MRLSTEPARLGRHLPPHEGAMPHLFEDVSVQESPDGYLSLL
ncbi:hypothetical protein [Streptomyces sp. JNUCC 63]